MKVLVTPRSFGKTDPEAWRMLEHAGIEAIRNPYGAILTEDQLRERLVDCDGIVIGIDPLPEAVLAAAPKLRAIAKYGVGVDNIDLDYCRQHGIRVSRTLGANTEAVADFTFALILAAARQIPFIDRRCRLGDWSKITTLDVHGKTLGLLGLGAIGKAVARRANGFNMCILSYDPVWDGDFARACGVERTALDDIYRKADFISLHLPLLPETQNIIGEAQLRLMKQTAIIINTARGGLIQETALLSALQDKRIHAAGIDAFSIEPPENPAWYALDNLVISSHAAASTEGAITVVGRMAAQNIINDLGICNPTLNMVE